MARYQVILDVYPRLESIGTEISEVQTYLDKLSPITAAIMVPPLLQSLPGSLSGAVDGLVAAQNRGMAEVTAAAAVALSRTQSMNTTEGVATDAVVTSLFNRASPALSTWQALTSNNVNQLIRRANALNLASASMSNITALRQQISGTSPLVAQHALDVQRGVLNLLAMQRVMFAGTTFNLTNNFTSRDLPGILSQSSNNSVARSAQLVTKTRNSTATYFAAGANFQATLRQTNTSVASLVNSFAVSRPPLTTKRRLDGGSQLTEILSNLLNVSTTLNSTTTSLNSTLSTSVNSTLAATKAYDWLRGNMSVIQNLISNISSPSVTLWDNTAKTTLAKLQGYIDAASSYMSSKAKGGSSSGNDAVMESVLKSMASVGAIQTQLNNELMKRQSAAIEQVNALTRKMQASGLSFTNLIAAIQYLMKALSTAGGNVDPKMAVFGYLQPALTALAYNVSSSSSNFTSKLTSSSSQITTNLDAYKNIVQGVWTKEAAYGNAVTLSNFVKAKIDAAQADITSNVAGWKSTSKQMNTAKSGAMAIASAVQSSLASVERSVSAVIAQQVQLLTSKQTLLLGNNTGMVQSLLPGIVSSLQAFYSQIAVLQTQMRQSVWKAGNGTISSFASDATARLRQFDTLRKTRLTDTSTKVTVPVKQLYQALASANKTAVATVTRFNSKVTGGLGRFSVLLANLEAKKKTAVLDPLPASIDAALKAGLEPSKVQVNEQLLFLKSALANLQTNLVAANTTLVATHKSILETNSALSSTGGSAVDQIYSLLTSASKIDSILKSQLALLSGSVTNATSAYNLTTRSARIAALVPSLLTRLKSNSTSLLANSTAALTSATSQLATLNVPLANTYLAKRPVTANTTFQDTVKLTYIDPLLQGLSLAVSKYSSSKRTTQTMPSGINFTASTDSTAKLLEMVKSFTAQSASTAKEGMASALKLLNASLVTAANVTAGQAAQATATAVAAFTNAQGAVDATASADSLVTATLASESAARLNSISALTNQLAAANVSVQEAFVEGLSSAGLAPVLAAVALNDFAASVQNELGMLGIASNQSTSKLAEIAAAIERERSLTLSDLLAAMNQLSLQQSQVSAGPLEALLFGFEDELSEAESWVESKSSSGELDLSPEIDLTVLNASTETGYTVVADQLAAASRDVSSMLAMAA